MQEGGRDLRIADFIRDEISMIIQREMRDPRVGLISITEVKVSKDLAFADLYFSCLDAESDAQQAEITGVLNKAAGYFRSALAKRHTMRTTPKPRFHYDVVGARAPKLEALISKAIESDERQRDDAEPPSGGSNG